MLNPYQDMLAERSLVTTPTDEGENWNFRWYLDPITNGMSKWYHFNVSVLAGTKLIAVHGWLSARDEDELLAQEQALEFIKKRYERFGLDEEDVD